MVRIWNLPVRLLDRQHLLGEHVETHIVVNAILRGGGAWYNHPTTNRFKGNLGKLVYRHNQQIRDMKRRGYNHMSPLPIDIKPVKYSYSRSEYNKDYGVLKERRGLL